ncbi:hypothetical protein [Leucobacter aridicollis]|uniref:Hydantoinase/oxoprolinase-like protein n=1 Tax=Leucobacter aridicollis TaxID=283878 RepID=A0A852R9X3_9MICO|nr:hypothetical protein [Leucobacter aridicollis]MBL3680831.1 hypothetical protein [Leucobacter aridicollis]NYD28165.1 hypothetical protein [Leucobacter aridicollis]
MRIGVRITNERVVGVSVTDAGIREECCEKTAPGAAFDTALDAVLAGLSAGAADRLAVSITFDVSGLFAEEGDRDVTAVRIAPRPPMDDAHLFSGESVAKRLANVVHVSGGHANSGDALVAFDERGLRRELERLPAGGRYVVTSVGAAVNPAHELEAGRILLEHADPASVVYSHSFHNTSFSIRERTGVLNASYLAHAGAIATALATVVSQRVPGARLFVMTNDGGATPLAGLSLKPVHSLYAGAAAEFVGVAALAGLDDGRMVIRRDGDNRFGEVVSGAPTVVARSRDDSGELLATRTVHLAPLADSAIGDWMGEPLEVCVGAGGAVEIGGAGGAELSAPNLGALGAACSQLVEWFESPVLINSPAEKDQALANAEAKVRARLVSYGARPSQVRILDSRVVGTSYQDANVVTVRVRGVGGPTPSLALAGVAR